ncbi:PDR/VanB family oxidoreductase [Streptomyces sp. NPDC001978]|uniref:PDR/VanB family oxidoreductase n=1 Tax=Streptomyces sp. NPDC001978 TaxID=3364627 RepID=UPI0036AFDF97
MTESVASTSTTELMLRVEAVRRAAEGVVVVEFVDPDGDELPEWTPGSHLEIVLPSGLVRHYSLCGDPANRRSYSVAVLRVGDGRGGSIEIHDSGIVGRTLVVRCPRNRFPLEDAPDYLFLAGGIGVTPLLPMARQLVQTGKSYMMVYGARSSGSFAFADDLRGLAGDRIRFVDESVDGRPDFATALDAARPGTAVYCCGPEGMIRAIEQLVAERAGTVNLHVERFVPSGTVEVSREGDQDFEIFLERTGRSVFVPADRTALEMVREILPSHPYSCLEGECGSCEVAVLEGEVDHRDEVLTDEEKAENTAMMLCVSRARSSKLVIDL